MAEIFGIRTLHNSISPIDEEGEGVIKKLKTGEPYKIKIWKPRKIKFHRKFFSLLNVIYDMQEFYDNKQVLRYWLIMKAGYFKMHVSPTGKPMYFAESIAFDKMDDTRFQDLYNKVIDVAISNENICGGSTYDEINGKVNEIINYT